MSEPASAAGPVSRREAEGAKLLRKLCQDDAVLAQAAGSLRLTMQRQGGPRSCKVDAEVVQFCLAQDWLRLKGSRLEPTEPGRAWLKRLDAGEDSFRRQHQSRKTTEVEIEGARRPAVINEGESPLGWPKNRKDRNGRPLISAAQYEAGERLRADYTFAHLTPRTTANWDAPAPTAGGAAGAAIGCGRPAGRGVGCEGTGGKGTGSSRA